MLNTYNQYNTEYSKCNIRIIIYIHTIFTNSCSVTTFIYSVDNE